MELGMSLDMEMRRFLLNTNQNAREEDKQNGIFIALSTVKLPYEPVCPLVDRLVGRSVCVL